MSDSLYEVFGGPILIIKQAFLTSIPLAMIFVASKMFVSLFLNLVITVFFSVIVISTFLPSSYFFAAMIPTVRFSKNEL
jgi:hypothetical protein